MLQPLLGYGDPATKMLPLNGTWGKMSGGQASEKDTPPLDQANIVILNGKIFLFSKDRKDLFILNGNASDADISEAKRLIKVLDKNTRGNVLVGSVEGSIRANNCLVIANPDGSKVDVSKKGDAATIIFSNKITLSPDSQGDKPIKSVRDCISTDSGEKKPETGDANGAFVGNSDDCTQTYSVDAYMLNCKNTGIDDTDQITVIGHNGSRFSHFRGMEGSFFLNEDSNQGNVRANDSCNSIGINIHNVGIHGSSGTFLKDLENLIVNDSARVIVVGDEHPQKLNRQAGFSNVSRDDRQLKRSGLDARGQSVRLQEVFVCELDQSLRKLLGDLTNPDADLAQLKASWFSPKSIATLVREADSFLK